MSFKIVFMGTPEFSIPTLEALFKSKFNIVSVYTQPPAKSKRGKKINASPIEEFSKKNKINFRSPINLNSDEEFKIFKELSADLIVVVAYGQLIPKIYLKTVKLGFINVHASLLPKWRGAAPIQRSIMNLDNETGVSIMKITEVLDTGPVMHQARISMNQNTDAKILTKVLSQLGAKALLDSINKIADGTAKFKEQDHSVATYAKKISKAEGKIQWNVGAKKILAKINGLNPNPGAWFVYKKERFKIWKAEMVNENGEPGKTLDDKLTIACKEGSIKILEIQKEGKSRQEVDQFLLGNNIKQGESIA